MYVRPCIHYTITTIVYVHLYIHSTFELYFLTHSCSFLTTRSRSPCKHGPLWLTPLLAADRHEKHLAFHQAFPERFAPDDVLAEQQGKNAQTYQSLPVYFSNVCLRFLPVFDLLIQRFLECPHLLGDSIGLILDQMGSLYKFHGQ